MTHFSIGDKSKAVCGFCDEVVATTFKVRDVPVSDTDIVVHGILVGVCDQCDQVIAVPEQTTPAIKQAMDEARN